MQNLPTKKKTKLNCFIRIPCLTCPLVFFCSDVDYTADFECAGDLLSIYLRVYKCKWCISLKFLAKTCYFSYGNYHLLVKLRVCGKWTENRWGYFDYLNRIFSKVFNYMFMTWTSVFKRWVIFRWYFCRAQKRLRYESLESCMENHNSIMTFSSFYTNEQQRLQTICQLLSSTWAQLV